MNCKLYKFIDGTAWAFVINLVSSDLFSTLNQSCFGYLKYWHYNEKGTIFEVT